MFEDRRGTEINCEGLRVNAGWRRRTAGRERAKEREREIQRERKSESTVERREEEGGSERAREKASGIVHGWVSGCHGDNRSLKLCFY